MFFLSVSQQRDMLLLGGTGLARAGDTVDLFFIYSPKRVQVRYSTLQRQASSPTRELVDLSGFDAMTNAGNATLRLTPEDSISRVCHPILSVTPSGVHEMSLLY
jgi:hypothetical protein